MEVNMPTWLTRVLLFLSSYLPLTIIFFVLYSDKQFWLGLSALSLGLIGFLGLLVLLRWERDFSPIQVKVHSVQRKDGEAMSYIVTYFIPFLAIPFSDWQQAVALSTFLIVLGILYINSNMIHINPMLNLMGYHIYELTLEDGDKRSLVTKRRIRQNAQLSVIVLGEEILMEKPS